MLIPGNSLFLSLICAIKSCPTFSAICIDFVVLYPVVDILYLIAIIFLTSSIFSFDISYLLLNLFIASSGVASSFILYLAFHVANSSPLIVYSYGLIFTGNVSVYAT